MDSADRARLRTTAWLLLRDLIGERTGIHFDQSNLDLMIDKLSTAMSERGVDSPTDYYYLLKYDSDADTEWAVLMNAITVRETYFSREMDQIRGFVDVLMPELCSKLTEPVRIWSAACASGEEPLTIAMALEDAGWFARHPIEIYASDMSSAAICDAQRGIYRERAFRSLPSELRSRYFRSVASGWEVDPLIQRRVQWRRANLMNRSEIEDLAASRVIFCRNVFIYFTESTIKKVVQVFEDCMPDPSYLFLAAAESLLKFTTKFSLAEIGDAFVYVKGRN
jgi:chemotaxis protein methyltransferase CheR